MQFALKNWISSLGTTKKEKIVKPCPYEMSLPATIRRIMIVIHGLSPNVNEFTCHVSTYKNIFQLQEGIDYLVAPIIQEENQGNLTAVTNLFIQAIPISNLDFMSDIIIIALSNGGRIATLLTEFLVRNQIGSQKILITLASPLKGTNIVAYASKIPITQKALISKLGIELYQELIPGSEETIHIQEVTKFLKQNGVWIYRVGGNNDLIVNPPTTTYFTGEDHILIFGADHGTIFGHPITLQYLIQIAAATNGNKPIQTKSIKSPRKSPRKSPKRKSPRRSSRKSRI